MPQISVIIPVYNSEKYIPRCIESLAAQIYTDFEVLLINDGSKDNSLKVCNTMKEKYSFVSVFDKPNGGAASARNLGLDNAKGKYVCFVDSDDWCEPEYLSTLFNLISKNNSQLSMVGIKTIENETVKNVNIYSSEKIFTETSKLTELQAGCFCNKLTDFETFDIGIGTPWDKLYSLEIINNNNIRFNTNLKVGEDTYFVWNYFNYVKSYAYSPINLYNYVIYTNSLSRRYVSIEDFEITKETFIKEIKSGLPEITFDSLVYTVFRHFTSLVKRGFANPNNKESFTVTKNKLKYLKNQEDFKFIIKNLNPETLNKREIFIKNLIKFPNLFTLFVITIRRK